MGVDEILFDFVVVERDIFVDNEYECIIVSF
jgi:hypothetical protein